MFLILGNSTIAQFSADWEDIFAPAIKTYSHDFFSNKKKNMKSETLSTKRNLQTCLQRLPQQSENQSFAHVSLRNQHSA